MTIQGKALTPTEKETIVELKKYFDRTKEDMQEQACPSVQWNSSGNRENRGTLVRSLLY